MSSERPRFIELPPESTVYDPRRLGSPSPRTELSSPRSGEIPPALSPLDAFALQGRLLAAKFEEQDGRRISRLAPLTVANEFAKPRPTYFSRPFQNGDYPTAPQPPQAEPSGTSPEVSRPNNKHTSFYPSIQGAADGTSDSTLEALSRERPTLEPVSEERSPEIGGQPDMERSMSPEPMQYQHPSTDTSRIDFAPEPPRKTPTNESMKSNWSYNHGLVPPPRSPLFPPRSPRGQTSIRSVRMDSGDDSDAMSFQSDPYDLTTYQRKPSVKSVRDNRPRSPFSPTFSGRRSPSISSEISNTELQQPPRRSMNFSRPLSPAVRARPSAPGDSDQTNRMLTVESPPVRPSVDGISIQDSLNDLEAPTNPWADDNASSHLTDDEQASNPPENLPTSYTYAKYALPRGRKVVSNGSFKAQSWLAHQFEWDHPTVDTPTAITQENDKPAQPEYFDQDLQDDFTLERQPTLPSIADEQPSPDPQPARHALHKPQASYSDYIAKIPPEPLEPERPVIARSKSYDANMARPMGQSRFHEEGIAEPLPSRPKSQKSDAPFPSSTDTSPNVQKQVFFEAPTLTSKSEEKPRKSSDKKRGKEPARDAYTPTPDQVPAEEHLAKGIELHESGNVQKATYHLRIAARAGLPSAMLLYALACRHGWGMRPNQQEAVLWLRKAVDISRLEVDQEAPDHLLPPSYGGPQDPAKAKQHKAQLALSIYELGVSYLNGWGIQQDKALALKCFEIAAGWGDADALSEAGFCYAKGVGCKKDLTKAAGYYRRAEKQGVSMAGNSWIHKEKYDVKKEGADDGGRGRKQSTSTTQKRDKSRTRTFFGGRKKNPDLPS